LRVELERGDAGLLTLSPHVVERERARGDRALGDAPLEALEQGLRVALDEERGAAAGRRLDEEIGELGLDARVEVELRLLEQQERPARREDARDDDGQHVREPRADRSEAQGVAVRPEPYARLE